MVIKLDSLNKFHEENILTWFAKVAEVNPERLNMKSHTMEKIMLMSRRGKLQNCKITSACFLPTQIDLKLAVRTTMLWKVKISIDSFQILMIKNPRIWLGQRHTRPHLSKTGSLRCYLPLMITFMQKINDINMAL